MHISFRSSSYLIIQICKSDLSTRVINQTDEKTNINKFIVTVLLMTKKQNNM